MLVQSFEVPGKLGALHPRASQIVCFEELVDVIEFSECYILSFKALGIGVQSLIEI